MHPDSERAIAIMEGKYNEILANDKAVRHMRGVLLDIGVTQYTIDKTFKYMFDLGQIHTLETINELAMERLK